MFKVLIITMTLSLIVTLAAPLTVYAADTEVSGTVSSYYTLTVPETVNLSSLDPANSTDSTPLTISVATNDTAKTSVNIQVVDNAHAGKLTNGGISLSSPLVIFGGNLTQATLSDSTASLSNASLTSSGNEKVWEETNMIIRQPAFNTVAPGTYTTTITFTAAFNP